MCEIIINGKTVIFESSVLTEEALKPYRETARRIVICDSVIEIRDKAFSFFRMLESIEIPNSVNLIGISAFWGCSALKSIVFPDSITELHVSVCKNCKSLENVVIPESVQIISDYAFAECRALKNIRVPNSVTHIGKHAFSQCISLQNVEIPDSIIKVSDGAFWGCASLKSISLPDSVTYVGNRAFYGCDTIRLEINGSEQILTLKALTGYNGQIISVDIAGDEYFLLTCNNFDENKTMMVITGYVDYADRKLYSGYEFNSELNPQNKKLLYCCYKENSYIFYDATMDGLKRQFDIFGIR